MRALVLFCPLGMAQRGESDETRVWALMVIVVVTWLDQMAGMAQLRKSCASDLRVARRLPPAQSGLSVALWTLRPERNAAASSLLGQHKERAAFDPA